ncbi:aldo/keto reductase [Herbiconiux moechotypicola]|uniref:Aldo/keto reductase n=1 Tax=Herbiconiux moechotypicola TaxID=637393 RepID=A0ABP5QJN2_9MICO|nr:aldo/keto reductase [Herbiconiux moechotypicola]MCS5730436.1 aldo/keto reductase [Herbiconiux moechotypicola]
MTVSTAPLPTRVFGRTGLTVSSLCVGTGAWGLDSPVHGLTVTEDDAVATALHAFRGPVTVLDTSNNYGDGESERRVGLALRRETPPEGFVVQTKLDRDPVTGSFDAERMRASLHESLDRLGVTRVPVLYLHDPENIGFEAAMAPGGPVESLRRFRDEGYADHIGVAGGPSSMLRSFVDSGYFDALITHNRFTLVDRSSDALLDAAAEQGLGVMNAAVYGGGLLASWPRTSDRYHYRTAPAELLAAVDAMGAACARHGVPLIAAALQFSTRDPRIHSTVCGVVSPAQLDAAIEAVSIEIPDELWAELESLVPSETTWIRD